MIFWKPRDQLSRSSHCSPSVSTSTAASRSSAAQPCSRERGLSPPSRAARELAQNLDLKSSSLHPLPSSSIMSGYNSCLFGFREDKRFAKNHRGMMKPPSLGPSISGFPRALSERCQLTVPERSLGEANVSGSGTSERHT